MYEAAKVGDEDDVKALIKKVIFSYLCDERRASLCYSAFVCRLMKKCLSQGAKVNFPNGVQNMESALHIACVNGNLNAAMTLLDHNGLDF